uniref:Uncharacterized protein n=1 Tax=Rhizophora mucronata TaxID=61149 RepID=A0A2P2R498_RHIMU
MPIVYLDDMLGFKIWFWQK